VRCTWWCAPGLGDGDEVITTFSFIACNCLLYERACRAVDIDPHPQSDCVAPPPPSP
jgi:hypothetical protein